MRPTDVITSLRYIDLAKFDFALFLFESALLDVHFTCFCRYYLLNASSSASITLASSRFLPSFDCLFALWADKYYFHISLYIAFTLSLLLSLLIAVRKKWCFWLSHVMAYLILVISLLLPYEEAIFDTLLIFIILRFNAVLLQIKYRLLYLLYHLLS